MHLTIPISIAIWCTIFHLIFINIVSSESSALFRNSSNEVMPWGSGRTKRSLFDDMPSTLKVQFKYESHVKETLESGIIIEYPKVDEFSLTLVKQKNHLANQYLPVMLNKKSLSPATMAAIGEFVLYHDLEKCSAVIYFENENSLSGYIGLEYTISKVPNTFDESGNYQGIVEQPYIVKRPEGVGHDTYPLSSSVDIVAPTSSNQNSNGGSKRPAESEPGPSGKRPRTELSSDEENHHAVPTANVSPVDRVRKRRTWNSLLQDYYLEILLFVTRDVVDIYKVQYGEDEYSKAIVIDYINYFNAADMIFQKLQDSSIDIHINIAQIIIEDKNEPFDFISDNDLGFTDTVNKLRTYLTTHRHVYTPDSFDHVFISTSRPIVHYGVHVKGMTDRNSELYEAREENQWYDAVPITVLGYLEDYARAVHEIGKTFEIEIESWNRGLGSTGQCYSIMQMEGSKCDACLTWTDDHKLEFIQFIRGNNNRCFLMNKPRSLRPPGPSLALSALKQCLCAGYDYHIQNGKRTTYVAYELCDAHLQCRRFVDGRFDTHYITRPFDGTPCTTHHSTKVCWDGKCTAAAYKSCMRP